MAKHPLQKLFDEAGIETRSYSGRSMYGKECLGIDVDDFSDFLERYTQAIFDQTENLKLIEQEEIVLGVRSVQTDSMGMGIIVYFTVVPYTSDDEEEGEEDEGEEEGDES